MWEKGVQNSKCRGLEALVCLVRVKDCKEGSVVQCSGQGRVARDEAKRGWGCWICNAMKASVQALLLTSYRMFLNTSHTAN